MKYQGPKRFCAWMTNNVQTCSKTQREYRYHPRSDAHSIAICVFVAADLLHGSAEIRAAARKENFAFAINSEFRFSDGKAKALDLAGGIAAPETISTENDVGIPITKAPLTELRIACEAKAVMTEHVKSEPRVFSELNDSHQIAHRAPNCIASGIVVVNAAKRFLSPLRNNIKGQRKLEWTSHTQLHVTERMVQHLRGLPRSTESSPAGFDAFGVFVASCDNIGKATLVERSPAPQGGNRDHYDSFIEDIVKLYRVRFS